MFCLGLDCLDELTCVMEHSYQILCYGCVGMCGSPLETLRKGHYIWHCHEFGCINWKPPISIAAWTLDS